MYNPIGMRNQDVVGGRVPPPQACRLGEILTPPHTRTILTPPLTMPTPAPPLTSAPSAGLQHAAGSHDATAAARSAWRPHPPGGSPWFCPGAVHSYTASEWTGGASLSPWKRCPSPSSTLTPRQGTSPTISGRIWKETSSVLWQEGTGVGCQSNAWSGHTPRLWVPSPVGMCKESNPSKFLSHYHLPPLSFSFFPFLSKFIKHILKWEIF